MVTTRLLALGLLGAIGCSGSPKGGGAPPGQTGAPLQLSSPAFTLQPGEEVFKCWYTTADSSVDLAATRLHSTMTPGSHHFIVYTTATPQRPDGTFEDCGDKQGGPTIKDTPVWLYATQDPEHELTMPAGTALPLKAHQPLYFNMHYINATSAAMTVQVTLDVRSTTGAYQRAGAFITYNTQINIPAGGTQTVSGDCTPPAGANFFTMSTHSHKRTTDAMAARAVGGTPGEMLVHTTDWEHATVSDWGAPGYLTFAPGEQLHYQCSYRNDTSAAITVGESAAKNEMCMAVGYYFPATGDTFCLNSSIFTF